MCTCTDDLPLLPHYGSSPLTPRHTPSAHTLIIDLTQLHACIVDVAKHVAYVQSACTTGTLDREGMTCACMCGMCVVVVYVAQMRRYG